MARPKKEIDWEEVEKRMEAGNTARQIAAICNINIDTFYDRFKEEFLCSFEDLKPLKYDCGNANILFVQYIKALKGNIRMLELLGRERCGQSRIPDDKEINVEEAKKNFDSKMDHIIGLLSHRNIDESSISNET